MFSTAVAAKDAEAVPASKDATGGTEPEQWIKTYSLRPCLSNQPITFTNYQQIIKDVQQCRCILT